MANPEACELWIEQEIDEGLKADKNFSQIGKELSEDIKRLFEVFVSPDAIRKRASRISSRTNVQPSKPTKSHTKPDTKSQLEKVSNLFFNKSHLSP